MKMWFTLVAAVALMAAMACTSMAFDAGDIVYEEDDDDYDTVSTLIPGEKYYVILVGEDD